MRLSRRSFLAQLLQPQEQTKQRDEETHFLNRVTFGPRPRDVARINEIGMEAYLEEQLHPERIDDEEARRRTNHLGILRMSRRELFALGEEAGYRSSLVLQEGILLRAVHSERQLLERMVAFWRDHFNVYGGDDIERELVGYEETVLRPHALGKFRDLLIGTAKSPAMLIYLDNYVNYAEAPNENYARELLELHTLGVDGGHYSEEDVREVARAFTGWTIHNRTDDGFWFNPNEHDSGRKTILGRNFPSGRGIEDGLHVLSIFARHPATAAFLSRKLCTHFVADFPPANLVNSTTAVWLETDGDIKSVLRHIFFSAEFAQAQGQKFRRPFEYFVGLLRATGTVVTEGWQLEEMLLLTQQRPYDWPAPNGYPDVAPAWISTSGLLQRWNFAMQLSHGAYSDPYDLGWGMQTKLHEPIGQPDTVDQLVDSVASQVFGAALVGGQRSEFVNYASDGAGGEMAVTPHLLSRKLGTLYGLMLASPQYQWS